MMGALDTAVDQAGGGTKVRWIEGHMSGPLHAMARPLSSLGPENGPDAGLFSALVSPRRNPAGQITRAGNIPAEG